MSFNGVFSKAENGQLMRFRDCVYERMERREDEAEAEISLH